MGPQSKKPRALLHGAHGFVAAWIPLARGAALLPFAGSFACYVTGGGEAPGRKNLVAGQAILEHQHVADQWQWHFKAGHCDGRDVHFDAQRVLMAPNVMLSQLLVAPIQLPGGHSTREELRDGTR